MQKAMTVPASPDRQAFLANLRESGLLANGQVGPVLRRLPSDARACTVASALVEAGLLTRFQADHLLTGRVRGFLLGPYRILEQIGRGGMGRVYRAEHRTMGRQVAVKVLAPSVVQSDRAVELFRREMRAIAHLMHPNIVTAYDASEDHGYHYLVLEYVDGPNLDQLVRREGRLHVEVACDCIRQVAQGLQCAHDAGMVHRDIKPANLLIQRRGAAEATPGLVKISDFGLARLQPQANPTATRLGTIFVKENTVLGTPDYLSPEQARNLHAADIRSDLYSLGCTFYFVLSGRVPFPGGTSVDKLIRHGTETPTPLEDLRPDLPPAVVAIVRKLMAKRPEDRFQTPAELVAALEPFAASNPTPWAPPPSAIPIATAVHAEADDCAVGGHDPVAGGSAPDRGGPGSTVVHERSPSPAPPSEPLHFARVVSASQRQTEERRIQQALFAAIGIVAAVVAFIVFLLLHSR
jgi:serine/threonine protein kinase